MEVGSIADWVSGIGSIGAAVTALYLAGSERRARAIADRPGINVQVSGIGPDGWLTVQIRLENRSTFHWQMTAVEAVKPRLAKITLTSAGYIANEEKPWEPGILDEELQRNSLARKITTAIQVASVGTPGGASNNHKPRDAAAVTYLVNLPRRASTLKLKLHFSSSEPIANDFTQAVVRKLDRG
jgi:hypothetical protein